MFRPNQYLLWNVALLFLFSLTVFAQPARTLTSTISGNVTLDGQPAEAVTVIVTSADATNSREVRHLARAVTDNAGRYRLAGLPAGNYRVQAAAPGLILEEQSVTFFRWGVSSTSTAAKPLKT